MLTLFVAVVVIFVNVKANVFDVITPPAYFYAPYTPFNDDDPNNIRPTINIDAIEDIVENAIDNGVNIFFIGGSNGQFTALSVDERKSLCLAYSQAINNTGNDGIYSIFHVGICYPY